MVNRTETLIYLFCLTSAGIQLGILIYSTALLMGGSIHSLKSTKLHIHTQLFQEIYIILNHSLWIWAPTSGLPILRHFLQLHQSKMTTEGTHSICTNYRYFQIDCLSWQAPWCNKGFVSCKVDAGIILLKLSKKGN